MNENHSKKLQYWQQACYLPSKKRGLHLISHEIETIVASMPRIECGLLHLFLQHTSASLTISENASSEVPLDLESFLNRTVPEDNQLYRHTLEGEDDMPSHIKNMLLGASLTIPLQQGQLALGHWQGIYLCEHRNHAHARTLLLTGHGWEVNPLCP